MEKPKNLPRDPGVYLFKDEHEKVLYVGKAKNLKSRVGSYFSKGDHPSTSLRVNRPWIAVMMGVIQEVETIVVNNEIEALILEATLINEHQPKFNIKLMDDKAYPFIKLTTKERFPRLQVVRQRTKDGAQYFGPYLSSWSANLACQFLRRVYGVHLASKPLPTGQDRPCLNCQLEGNSCPMADQISPEAYAKQVNTTVEFLEGKRKNIIRDIEQRMQQAAENESFELAGKLRDQLKAVWHVTSSQKVVGSTQESFDAIGTAITGNRSVVTVEDQGLISTWLSQQQGYRIELRVPERGEKVDFIALANKNAQSKLESMLLKTEGTDFSSLIGLKELLCLAELPERIEAVDISNLGTSEPVGATVCFINGQPDKNEYRRYKIKTVEGQNDFA